MTFIRKIKRAARDQNAYSGLVDNDNWGLQEINAWSYLCDKFGGYFTAEPTERQPKTFSDFLDKYEDHGYTNTMDVSIPQKSGANLKGLIPQKQKVDTEGLTKKEAQIKEAVVNRNVVDLPETMKPSEPVKQNNRKVPTPKEVLKDEPIIDDSTLSLEQKKENIESNSNKGTTNVVESSTSNTKGTITTELKPIKKESKEPVIVESISGDIKSSETLGKEQGTTKEVIQTNTVGDGGTKISKDAETSKEPEVVKVVEPKSESSAVPTVNKSHIFSKSSNKAIRTR